MDLAFGSLDLRDRDAIFLDLIKGFYEPAQLRGRDVIVPSLAGRIPRSRIKDRRVIMLVGYVTGTSAADFLANMHDLRDAFDAGVDTLTIDDNYLGTDGSAWTIEARYMNMVVGDLQMGPKYATVSVELESVDPDWVEAP